MISSLRFKRAAGFEEAKKIRKNETEDLVGRFGVISPNRITIHNYPVSHPITSFNASVVYEEEDETLKLYARMILGYYMYVSSIIEVEVPLHDLFNGYVNMNSYVGRIVIYPSTKYDIWGTEDPRVYKVRGKLYMTYTGRSINYFSPIRVNRTVPVTAVYDEDLKNWIKRFVLIPSAKVFGRIITDKDAFLHEMGDGKLYFLHRPHLIDDTTRLMISKLDPKILSMGGMKVEEVEIDNAVEVLDLMPFEGKLGWAAPLVNIGDKKLITLIHATDKEQLAYRVFAAQLSLSDHEVVLEAVTPRYIMEPTTPYELIGDRPLTIFPCGAVKISKDEIVISYGAADYMIGLGILSLNNLMAELDKGRIY